MTPKVNILSATRAFALMGFLFLSAHGLFAEATYTYSGNDFTSAFGVYTPTDFSSASVTFDAALPDNLTLATENPISFSISDGVQTWTNLTASFSIFEFATDGAGDVIAWDVAAGLDPEDSGIKTQFQEGSGSDFAKEGPNTNSLGDGFNNDLPGTWTSDVAASDAPEPGTLLLSVGALALLGAKVFGHRRHAGSACAD
jgi:hypothetical protein